MKKIASEFSDPFNQNLNRVPTQVEMKIFGLIWIIKLIMRDYIHQMTK